MVKIDSPYGHAARRDDGTDEDTFVIIWLSIFQQSGDQLSLSHFIHPSCCPAGAAFL